MESALPPEQIAPQLERRRAAVVAAWDLTDEVVLIGAGELIGIPGRGEMTYPFRAHSEYLYLTDRNRPSGVLAFDPQDGWHDFVPSVTESDRLWAGDLGGDRDGVPMPEFAGWLAARGQRPIAHLGVAPLASRGDRQLTERLRLALSHVRRPKDRVELERMRIAERATRAAFAAVAPMLVEGVSEREAQIELEAAAFRHGGDAMAYDTIIGSGTNSAVLHFAPSARRFGPGELVLIDAGAEYRGYASDITRTYPVGGTLNSEQRELHSLVRAAELAAIGRCTAGTEWREVHRTAALVIAEGLVAAGLLCGSADDLVESGATWLFFPHGVGHLVGLGVRDAGGSLAGRQSTPPPFPNLRIDLPLRAGMVVTVEPGIYFVPALLQDPERRRRHRGQVDWDRVDALLGFGGIRIEDNVLITADRPEVLTADVPVLGATPD
ncbi:MAG: M24 family metallopeptidase [Solirubrobacteraceae bacterium]